MFFKREEDNQQAMRRCLRRICDLTSPNLPVCDETRSRDRNNRTLPVLVAPWEDGHLEVGQTALALTKDISDGGLSLTMPQPFRAEEVVVGFWVPKAQDGNPWFFRARVRQNVPIGGGFWALGIEVVELLAVRAGSELARLLTLAKELLPPQHVESAPPSALIR